MTIESDIQKLEPGKILELFVLDPTEQGGTAVCFHSGLNELQQPVVWQGVEYSPYPVEASGFELSGRGTMPQPKMRVADVASNITALCLELDDLLGAKLTRKRTFGKYLDTVNFVGGVNPTADPTQELADEIWFVNRKAEQRPGLYVDFDLAAPFDLSGKMIPGRQCIANACVWRYRGPECGYAGPPVADINDLPTSNPALDACGKRLPSCRLRFGQFAVLPYGAFPKTGLV
jgi:lambda family phage minor tail protein L